MPFVYYLQVYKSISDNSAAWLLDYGFVKKTNGIFANICFTKMIVFIFKTAGYNVEYDGMWDR